MHFMGTKGRIEIEIPFNAPPDRPCRLFVDDGSDLFGGSVETIEIPASDQYTVQADRFSEALRNGGINDARKKGLDGEKVARLRLSLVPILFRGRRCDHN